MVNYQRVALSIALGAVLGILCIVGVGSRLEGGYDANMVFLIAMWYNRVVMGLVIGLADGIILIGDNSRRSLKNAALRGLILGIVVSSAIYLSSGFRDLPSLIAGFAYGIVIDVVVTALGQEFRLPAQKSS